MMQEDMLARTSAAGPMRLHGITNNYRHPYRPNPTPFSNIPLKSKPPSSSASVQLSEATSKLSQDREVKKKPDPTPPREPVPTIKTEAPAPGDDDDESVDPGGAKGKRGRPRKHAPKIPLPPLYVFIRNLLHNPSYNPSVITWVDETIGCFKEGFPSEMSFS